MFFQLFFLLSLGFVTTARAQALPQDTTCTIELDTNIPESLKAPLIELIQLRLDLSKQNGSFDLSELYLSQLQTLKQSFLDLGYSSIFFDKVYVFFYQQESQNHLTNPLEDKKRQEHIQKQKNEVLKFPLRGRTPQVVRAIIRFFDIPEEQITLDHLTKIEKLDLSGEGITELTEHDFQGLTNLKNLYLSQNQLTELPENIFQGLHLLEFLILSHNQLNFLPENLFRDQKALNTLLLNNNKLTTLPPRIFQGLSDLEYLRLEFNLISEISEVVFTAPGLYRYVDVYLGNNLVTKETRQMLRRQLKDRLIIH